MNKIIIRGRIGNDAEVRTTQGGKTVASFSVAVDDGYGDNKRTEWMRCSLWGKRAEGGLVQYLTKGQEVLVEGKASVNAYVNKSGEAKGSIDIFVGDLELIGKKDQGESAPRGAQQDPHDDIPF